MCHVKKKKELILKSVSVHTTSDFEDTASSFWGMCGSIQKYQYVDLDMSFLESIFTSKYRSQVCFH